MESLPPPLPGDGPRPRVSVVVPAHNEEENLPLVLESLVPALAGAPATADYEIVVVNDNSRDRTGAIAESFAQANPRIRVVHRTETPGFGNAVKAGLKAARGEAIAPFMGDLSDDPHDLPRMRAKLDEGYDLVYGSRFIPGGGTLGYPRGKRVANRAFNNAVRLLFGVKYHDVSNAFKMYRREVLDAINLDTVESQHFDLTIELPLKAHILGFRAVELPVQWSGRDKGEAKFRLGRMGHRYGRRLLKLFFLGNLVALRDLFRALYAGPKWRLVVGALFGLLLLGGLLSFSGGSAALKPLANASWPLLGGAAAASLAALVARVWRWSVLLRSAEHRVSRESAYRCIMFGWLLNYLLPAKLGDVARGFALKTVERVPVGTSLATIAIERIQDLMVLAMFLAAGVFLYFNEQATVAEIAILSAGLITLLVVAVGTLGLYNGFLERRAPRLHGFLRHGRDGVRSVLTNPTAFALTMLLSFLVWVLEVSTVLFSARAFGLALPLDQLALVGAAAFLAQALPLTPAGLGLHEGAIQGVLVLFGVDKATGFAVGLADHVARGVVVYVLGSIATVHLGFQSREYFRTLHRPREASP